MSINSAKKGLTWVNFILLIIGLSLITIVVHYVLLNSFTNSFHVASLVVSLVVSILTSVIFYFRLKYLGHSLLLSVVPLLGVLSVPRLYLSLGIENYPLIQDYLLPTLGLIVGIFLIYYFFFKRDV